MRLVLLVGTLGLFAACSNPPEPEEPVAPPPAAPPPAVPTATAVVDTTPQKNPEVASVSISDKIRAACGISDYNTLFAYDSAAVSSSAQSVLKQLADCFTTGPLKGSAMRLIGHADPRGDEEYNMALGGRRAESVKRALVSAGLASAMATTTSRGEMDATGTDDVTWARDRRVDVILAE